LGRRFTDRWFRVVSRVTRHAGNSRGPFDMRSILTRHLARGAALLALGCSGAIDAPGSDSGTDTGGTDATPGKGGSSSAGNGGSGAAPGKGGSGSAGAGGTGNSTHGGSAGGTNPTEEECANQTGDALRVGRTRLRRLTRTELDNTVRDLLDVTDNPSSALTPDEQVGPFASNAISPVTDLIIAQHHEIAVRIAAASVPRANQIAGCELTNAACVRSFVTNFGRRAFRRPLSDSEIEAHVALFGVAKDAPNGFRLILEAMLQSPFFLYHSDVGATGEPTSRPSSLTSHELAARLSYFLWDSMPDPALSTLADSGALADATVLKTEVERMLADAKAADAIPLFHLEWLAINQREFGTLSSTQPELAAAMLAETSHFSDFVVRQGDGLLSTLFTADFSYPSGPLFELYGLTRPDDFEAGMQVRLNAQQRGGILTQPAFLVKHYRGSAGSVVHRGIAVRENVLCQPIDPPPLDVVISPLPPVEGSTARDRFRAHEADPTCGGCHSQIDPIGLALENYDGVGKYRTEDGGVVIDASGEILDAGEDVAGAFVGGVELGQKLAGSAQVRNCVANQWFRFSVGRMESNDDACALRTARREFARTGNVRELITNIVLSDAFRHVRAVGN
jgi:hypothetical protein